MFPIDLCSLQYLISRLLTTNRRADLQRATSIGLTGTKSDSLSLMSFFFFFSNMLYFTVKSRQLGLGNQKETFLHEFKKAPSLIFGKKKKFNWVCCSHVIFFKKSH